MVVAGLFSPPLNRPPSKTPTLQANTNAEDLQFYYFGGPIGKCKIQVSNQKHKVTFMVVPDETCANLIGSQAAQQMGFLDIHFEQLHNRSAAPKTREIHTHAVETSMKPNEP